jgi:hypothetical protein
VQLFARPQSGVFDCDVAVWIVWTLDGESSEPDHLSGNIIDPNRLPHIEDEDFSAFTHCASLDDKSGCL